MKTFLRTLMLFLVPLALFFAPTLFVFMASGEAYSIEQVERLAASNTTVLFGPAYSDYWAYLQKEEVLSRKPEVIALGASRVGQFRAAFFKDPADFYTASAAAFDIQNLSNFVESLGSSTPKVIIVSLDQHLFNPDNNKEYEAGRTNAFVRSGSIGSAFDVFLEGYFRNGGWWKIYGDYIAGKFTIRDLFAAPTSYRAIGLRARVEKSGGINDGSHYYGYLATDDQARQAVARDITAMADAVSTTIGYEYGDGVSDRALSQIDAFLALCKERGITVIGFIPPMPHAVYARMQQFPDAVYAQSFKELPRDLHSLFATYGFDSFDFSDPAAFGSGDNEMADAYHGSEKTYVRMMIKMAKSNAALGAYTDISKLERSLRESTNDYVVFPPQGL